MTTDESNIEQQTLHTESALVRERYDRTARHYDIMTWPMEVMAMDRYRSRLIAEVEGARVLEVGVGTGRNLSLYPEAVQVDAIDFSPRMLERAQRRPPIGDRDRVFAQFGGAAEADRADDGEDGHGEHVCRDDRTVDHVRDRIHRAAPASRGA
jgi:SAM-dependent methyltransferase